MIDVLQIVLLFVIAALIMTGVLVVKGRHEIAQAREALAAADALPSSRPLNPEMAHWYDEALNELGEYDPEAFEMLKYLRTPAGTPAPSVVRQITPLGGSTPHSGYIKVPHSVDTAALKESLKGWKAGRYNTVVLPEGTQYQQVVQYLTEPAQYVDDMKCAHCGAARRGHGQKTDKVPGHCWEPRGQSTFVEGCHCQSCEDYRTSVIDAIMEDLDEMDRAEKKAKPTAAQKAQAELEKAKAEYEYERNRRIELERQAASLRGTPGRTPAAEPRPLRGIS